MRHRRSVVVFSISSKKTSETTKYSVFEIKIAVNLIDILNFSNSNDANPVHGRLQYQETSLAAFSFLALSLYAVHTVNKTKYIIFQRRIKNKNIHLFSVMQTL